MLSAIRQRDIDDYLIDLKTIRDNKTPLKADAKNKIIVTLRHIMREAVAQGLIEKDPTEGLLWFQDAEETERQVALPQRS